MYQSSRCILSIHKKALDIEEKSNPAEPGLDKTGSFGQEPGGKSQSYPIRYDGLRIGTEIKVTNLHRGLTRYTQNTGS
ncbi:hypothetical protein RRG08_008065 [Elysia crispata]|uniref:Uncharacterized protein n=1 Tax=Elysia crispata TaxID=231223 RepID=A0AAE0Z8C8_9GAST|nr:hypothetical protein RRG08_008065 [Elysia crispata]